MTRQEFETEARKHGFILDRLDKSGVYVQLITEQAWIMWQAATAAALAAPAHPERRPMTDKDIAGAIVRGPDPMAFGKLPAEGWRPMVRLVEAHHGIGDKT